MSASGGGGAGPGGDSIILEEEIDPNYVPSQEEVMEYAKWLGMDLEADVEMFWIAKEGLKAPLPENWKPCKTTDTEEIYYFNFATGESTWDHPCDEYYRNLYEEQRKKKVAGQKELADTKKKRAKEDVKELLGKKAKSTSSKMAPPPLSSPSSKSIFDRKPLPSISSSLDASSSRRLEETAVNSAAPSPLPDSPLRRAPPSSSTTPSRVRDERREEKSEGGDGTLLRMTIKERDNLKDRVGELQMTIGEALASEKELERKLKRAEERADASDAEMRRYRDRGEDASRRAEAAEARRREAESDLRDENVKLKRKVAAHDAELDAARRGETRRVEERLSALTKQLEAAASLAGKRATEAEARAESAESDARRRSDELEEAQHENKKRVDDLEVRAARAEDLLVEERRKTADSVSSVRADAERRIAEAEARTERAQQRAAETAKSLTATETLFAQSSADLKAVQQRLELLTEDNNRLRSTSGGVNKNGNQEDDATASQLDRFKVELSSRDEKIRLISRSLESVEQRATAAEARELEALGRARDAETQFSREREKTTKAESEAGTLRTKLEQERIEFEKRLRDEAISARSKLDAAVRDTKLARAEADRNSAASKKAESDVVKQAETAAESAKRELTQANNVLEATKTDLAKTRASLESTKTELARSNSISKATNADLFEARNALEKIKTELASAKSDAEIAQASLLEALSSEKATRSELAGASSANEAAKADLVTAENSLQATKADLAVAKADAEAARAQLAEARRVRAEDSLTREGDPSLVENASGSCRVCAENVAMAEAAESLRVAVSAKLAITETNLSSAQIELARVTSEVKANKAASEDLLARLADANAQVAQLEEQSRQAETRAARAESALAAAVAERRVVATAKTETQGSGAFARILEDENVENLTTRLAAAENAAAAFEEKFMRAKAEVEDAELRATNSVAREASSRDALLKFEERSNELDRELRDSRAVIEDLTRSLAANNEERGDADAAEHRKLLDKLRVAEGDRSVLRARLNKLETVHRDELDAARARDAELTAQLRAIEDRSHKDLVEQRAKTREFESELREAERKLRDAEMRLEHAQDAAVRQAAVVADFSAVTSSRTSSDENGETVVLTMRAEAAERERDSAHSRALRAEAEAREALKNYEQARERAENAEAERDDLLRRVERAQADLARAKDDCHVAQQMNAELSHQIESLTAAQLSHAGAAAKEDGELPYGGRSRASSLTSQVPTLRTNEATTPNNRPRFSPAEASVTPPSSSSSANVPRQRGVREEQKQRGDRPVSHHWRERVGVEQESLAKATALVKRQREWLRRKQRKLQQRRDEWRRHGGRNGGSASDRRRLDSETSDLNRLVRQLRNIQAWLTERESKIRRVESVLQSTPQSSRGRHEHPETRSEDGKDEEDDAEEDISMELDRLSSQLDDDTRSLSTLLEPPESARPSYEHAPWPPGSYVVVHPPAGYPPYGYAQQPGSQQPQIPPFAFTPQPIRQPPPPAPPRPAEEPILSDWEVSQLDNVRSSLINAKLNLQAAKSRSGASEALSNQLKQWVQNRSQASDAVKNHLQWLETLRSELTTHCYGLQQLPLAVGSSSSHSIKQIMRDSPPYIPPPE